jgi:hypothetical protein
MAAVVFIDRPGWASSAWVIAYWRVTVPQVSDSAG